MRSVIAAILLFALALPAGATEAGWALLRGGGHVVLLRNAYAAGAVDPADLDIDDCATQRNLSDRGAQQARRIGALFAARADVPEKVMTSRLCICLETARLAFGAGSEVNALLDPLPADPERKQKLVDEMRAFRGPGNLVLVVPGDVITEIAGVKAREGEAVIVGERDGATQVLGRIVFN